MSIGTYIGKLESLLSSHRKFSVNHRTSKHSSTIMTENDIPSVSEKDIEYGGFTRFELELEVNMSILGPLIVLDKLISSSLFRH